MAEQDPVAQRQFTAAGRSWTISLPIGLARKIKADCGIDLPNAWKMDWAALDGLLADTWQFLDVLWKLVSASAAEAGIDRLTFEESLDQTAIESAAEALRWAVVGFIPRGERAQVLAAEKIQARAVELTVGKAMERLESPETAEQIDATVARLVKDRLAAAGQASGA